ncbi:hypothetical protein, partial [Bacillus safensis]|uniref:hypothetical protein n=1 Tax=Bacillus safensis TaxID=561879 RepID=UPI002FFE6459
ISNTFFCIQNLRLFQKGFTLKNVLSLNLTMLFTVSPESIAEGFKSTFPLKHKNLESFLAIKVFCIS